MNGQASLLKDRFQRFGFQELLAMHRDGHSAYEPISDPLVEVNMASFSIKDLKSCPLEGPNGIFPRDTGEPGHLHGDPHHFHFLRPLLPKQFFLLGHSP